MKSFTIQLPDSLDLENKEFSLLVAMRLYETGKLSIGQAATASGLSKVAFMELLSLYNVSIFNFPASDLANDVANA